MITNQYIEAAQIRAAEMAVEHQAQINALAIREATAKAETAEWEAARAKALFSATTEALRREGLLVGGRLS